MTNFYNYFNLPFFAVYDDAGAGGTGGAGDGGTGAGGAGTGASGAGAGDGGGTSAGGGTGAGTNPPPKKTYTEDEVKQMIEANAARHREQTNKTIEQLEKFRQSKELSDKEKSELAQRIEQMQEALLTKEQLAAKEKEKLEKEAKAALETANTQATFWKTQYETSTILRSIADASAKSNAFDTEQITALLQPRARLVENVDSEGKPTGYDVRVKYRDIDKENKPVTLDLTVEEAVKRMKETPEKFGNLFRGENSGGLGMAGSGTPTQVNVKSTDPDYYRKHVRGKLGLK